MKLFGYTITRTCPGSLAFFMSCAPKNTRPREALVRRMSGIKWSLQNIGGRILEGSVMKRTYPHNEQRLE